MIKTFQYRLYPTKSQETILVKTLEECQWLYNHFLSERKATYEKSGISVGLYDQQNSIPGLKSKRPDLTHCYSQVLQNVAFRVDRTFKVFFRRVKAGEKPGYPRFKGKFHYHSFTYPQITSRCAIYRDSVWLSKLGIIRAIIHRKLEGVPKTCTIKRSTTGKWFASFSCEVPQPKLLGVSNEQVGIDVGLQTFATLSNGEKIKRKRFFKIDEKELAKVQRKFAKEAKGTAERRKRRKPVARVHERIANRRHDFAHQNSRRIVNRFDFIAVEDLEVNRMMKGEYSKSIQDAAWSLFFILLLVKAESAGRKVVRVNPAYTSQTCSSCGHRQKMPLNKRVYVCPQCKLKLNRDHNAALNILRLGLQSGGIQPEEAPI